MKRKIVDGHVHLHYRRKASDEKIKKSLEKLRKLMEKYGVGMIAGIFAPENVNVVRS